MYRRVSEITGIPVDKIIEYDKHQWQFIKYQLNNPTFDTLEIPLLGSFNITRVKMGRTLRQSVIILRRLKKKAEKYPDNKKVQRDLELQLQNFRNLWKLKQMCKL